MINKSRFRADPKIYQLYNYPITVFASKSFILFIKADTQNKLEENQTKKEE
jgi:hypothetical protein